MSSPLDRLTEAHPACRVAAYADIGTKVVLTSSGDASRDTLNRLCAEARLTLGPLEVPPIGTGSCPVAIVAVEGETRLFVRSDSAGDEAIIVVCAEEVDLGQLLPATQACFSDLN